MITQDAYGPFFRLYKKASDYRFDKNAVKYPLVDGGHIRFVWHTKSYPKNEDTSKFNPKYIKLTFVDTQGRELMRTCEDVLNTISKDLEVRAVRDTMLRKQEISAYKNFRSPRGIHNTPRNLIQCAEDVFDEVVRIYLNSPETYPDVYALQDKARELCKKKPFTSGMNYGEAIKDAVHHTDKSKLALILSVGVSVPDWNSPDYRSEDERIYLYRDLLHSAVCDMITEACKSGEVFIV